MCGAYAKGWGAAMFELTDEEFVQAIENALESIPERFLDDLENVQIVAEDESDPARAGYTGADGLSELQNESDDGRGDDGDWLDDSCDYDDECGYDDSEYGGRDDLYAVRSESGSEVLGLYSGIPLTERGGSYGMPGTQPDTITIYKRPHERCFSTREDVVEQIRKTVVHEVGHYFGMDEAQVRAMGY